MQPQAELLPGWQDHLWDWQHQWESLALIRSVLPSEVDQLWCMQQHAHQLSGSSLQAQKQQSKVLASEGVRGSCRGWMLFAHVTGCMGNVCRLA